METRSRMKAASVNFCAMDRKRVTYGDVWKGEALPRERKCGVQRVVIGSQAILSENPGARNYSKHISGDGPETFSPLTPMHLLSLGCENPRARDLERRTSVVMFHKMFRPLSLMWHFISLRPEGRMDI